MCSKNGDGTIVTINITITSFAYDFISCSLFRYRVDGQRKGTFRLFVQSVPSHRTRRRIVITMERESDVCNTSIPIFGHQLHGLRYHHKADERSENPGDANHTISKWRFSGRNCVRGVLPIGSGADQANGFTDAAERLGGGTDEFQWKQPSWSQ